MARTDQRKLELWALRVGQHRANGLSVSKYCQREKLAVHDFDYWRRKLAGPGQRASKAAGLNNRTKKRHPGSPGGQSMGTFQFGFPYVLRRLKQWSQTEHWVHLSDGVDCDSA